MRNNQQKARKKLEHCKRKALLPRAGQKVFQHLFRLFKKLLSDRNKTLDELQQTQSNLQKNIPKIVKKPNTPRAAVVSVLFLLISIQQLTQIVAGIFITRRFN